MLLQNGIPYNPEIAGLASFKLMPAFCSFCAYATLHVGFVVVGY